MRAHALTLALCLAVQACALENPLSLPDGFDASATDDVFVAPPEDRGPTPTDVPAVDALTPDLPAVDAPAPDLTTADTDPRDDLPDLDDGAVDAGPRDVPAPDVSFDSGGDGRDASVTPDVTATDVPAMDIPPPDVTDGRDASVTPDVPVMDVPVVDVPVIDVPSVDRVDPVDTGPPPSPETCATATRIPETVGTQTLNGTTRGFRADYNGSCGRRSGSGSTNRPDAVYAVELTERRRVQITARGRGGTLDTVLYVSRDCGTLSGSDARLDREVACNDDVGSGDVSSALDLELPPGRWYIIVDGFESSASNPTSGDFTLSVTLSAPLGAPPLTISRGTGACPEAPTGFPSGSYQLHAILDDRATGSMSLPFSFRMLGRTYSNWAMTDNGYIQLLASGVSIDSEPVNTVIPRTSNPDSFVAPFWDDLLPVLGTRFVSWVTGSSPNRVLHVRWEDVARYRDMGARLTFGVELRETANTVTFRYCSLIGSDGPNARGGSATVGVEDEDGSAGVLVHLNEPDALSNGTSITLTP